MKNVPLDTRQVISEAPSASRSLAYSNEETKSNNKSKCSSGTLIITTAPNNKHKM